MESGGICCESGQWCALLASWDVGVEVGDSDKGRGERDHTALSLFKQGRPAAFALLWSIPRSPAYKLLLFLVQIKRKKVQVKVEQYSNKLQQFV